MEFTQKQKWMYLSFLVVIFSMFLPWAQLGIREISGWSNQAFMLLPAWFIPLYFVANRKSFPLLTRASITVGALGLLGFDPAENGFSLLGNHYEFEVGAGPYAYTLGLLLGLYGEFIIIDASSQKSSIEIEKVVQSSYSEKKRFDNIFRFEDLKSDSDYHQVSEEFTSDKRRRSLWQNCIDISNGDEEKAKFMYFKTRLQRLKDEVAGKQ